MDLNLTISITSLVISAIALILSFLISWKRMQISQFSLNLPIALDMINQYRSKDFKEHINYIRDKLGTFNVEGGYRGLPEDAREHATIVSNWFNHIGSLIIHKFIDDKFIISYIGENISEMWKKLAPFIKAERELRNFEAYQIHFQDLVNRVQKTPPTKIRKKMIKKYKEYVDFIKV